jgi:hypothetical protein
MDTRVPNFSASLHSSVSGSSVTVLDLGGITTGIKVASFWRFHH